MAGDEAAEGSGRMHMDLNLHVGLPPLPQPRVQLDTSTASSSTLMPPNLTGATPEAPTTGEPEESLAPAATTFSPSNTTLFALEEHPMLDPIVYSWLDGNSASGEEYTDAPEPSAPAPVDGLLVARSVRPSRVAAATGMEMVNTSTLGQQSTQGAAATTIELRFLRMIQISQQHNIVRPGSANLTQSSFEAARGPNPDGGDNSSFECTICLELARQPVVTSCGHLFCWPCLYQWLHAQSSSFECPVCKGEVLTGDITPIYGRGGEEEGVSTATTNPNLPPRPQAHRRESLRQQLQMAGRDGNTREMVRVLRQLIQDENQGWDAIPARVETTWVPAARQRAGARRQQRQDRNAAPAQVVLAAPQQPSSMEQLLTSSTAAAIVAGEPGPSSRSRRPSESPTIRRTRRRPQ
ncbi:hypothetical protein BDA96_07G055000 [Sorghum bicolor]|uniref:E3 ubiquitin-protein ligase RMA n=2 Tax=Sorghum bicolor TaxID=4558 RepID=A0A921U8F5_SORBI|nr:uncharacterized protein LOC8069642 [Sorghum bicolor]KAG0522642.1 hypothetical protein BDA96_07G055000 [Sorghum bicolor]KXG24507.2 hypothetical protein SORBI_3007G052000 [Sorghum bicolor]|eukprot:XP_002445108.1 uncharacterized protein LOC8069642 [Sorghum bicolor]